MLDAHTGAPYKPDPQSPKTATREVFGNIAPWMQVVFFVMIGASIGVLVWQVVTHVRLWRKGQPGGFERDWRVWIGRLVTYALVCIALPRHLRDLGVFRQGAQIIPWLACAAMVLALVGNLYPVPEGPYGKLPYVYLAYLAAGLLWFKLRGKSAVLAET